MALFGLLKRNVKQNQGENTPASVSQPLESASVRLERWQKVVSLDPNHIEAVLSLCSVLAELDRYDEVDSRLTELHSTFPDDRHVLYSVARQHLIMHRNEQALQAWQDINERWPNDVETLHNIATILTRCMKADQALEYADQLEKLDHERAAKIRVRALVLLERYEEILTILDQISNERNLDSAEELSMIESTDQVHGTEAGISMARKFLDKNPGNETTAIELVKLLIKADRNAEALEVLEQHAKEMNEICLHAVRRLNLMVKLNKIDEADVFAEQAIEQTPNDKELLLTHARVAQARFHSQRNAA